MVPTQTAPASLGDLLEIQTLRPPPRLTGSETLTVGPSQPCFNKPSRWFGRHESFLTVPAPLTGPVSDLLAHGLGRSTEKVSFIYASNSNELTPRASPGCNAHHCWCWYKLAASLKGCWAISQNLKIHSFNPAISFLGVYPTEIFVHIRIVHGCTI